VFVTDRAPQDLTDPSALLINEECRRHAAAGTCAENSPRLPSASPSAGGQAPTGMTPITTQDPIHRFTLRIEELRHVPGLHGLALLVHNLMFALFMSMIRLFAALAKRARAGTLAETAPAPQAGASPRPTGAPDPSRVRPPDLRPRHDGTMHARFEQPEMQEQIAEPPCQMPAIEQTAGLPLPPRARVRKRKESSGPAPSRARHVHDGCWPRWRGPGLLSTADAGFLRLDSKKWVSGGGDSCVQFVTL
jgi:hypothetical protein